MHISLPASPGFSIFTWNNFSTDLSAASACFSWKAFALLKAILIETEIGCSFGTKTLQSALPKNVHFFWVSVYHVSRYAERQSHERAMLSRQTDVTKTLGHSWCVSHHFNFSNFQSIILPIIYTLLDLFAQDHCRSQEISTWNLAFFDFGLVLIWQPSE